MPDDVAREVADLARQLREHLRYYEELGITDIVAAPMKSPLAPPSEIPSTRFLYQSAEAPTPVEEVAVKRESNTSAQRDLFEEAKTEPARKPDALPRIPAPGETLEAIRSDLGECTRCRLHEGRRNIVFGEGSPRAHLMFIGEGPGADEDATGRPFVGRAGQLLDKIIAAIGMHREEVYIANIVKCRPPENRAPERDEVARCEPFLFRQIASIQPRVIVTLGSPALQCLFRSRESITRVRGEWREWNGIMVMPTFHPAYLLRSPDKKRETWADMKKVRDYLATATS